VQGCIWQSAVFTTVLHGDGATVYRGIAVPRYYSGNGDRLHGSTGWMATEIRRTGTINFTCKNS